MSRQIIIVLAIVSCSLAADVVIGGTVVVWDCTEPNGFPSTHELCTDIPPDNNVVDIDTDGRFAIALMDDGSLFAWGDSDPEALEVPDGNDFVKIVAAFHDVGLALRQDGSIIAWGDDWSGFCSNAPSDDGFTDIAAGSGTGLAIAADGSLISWGYYSCDANEPNECDPNTYIVPEGNDFIDIACGGMFSVALRDNGSIVAWGRDYQGLLNVPDGNDYVKIVTSGGHALALKEDGKVVAWGGNAYGRCDVPDGNYIDISADGYNSLAIKADGSLAAWGRNLEGLLNVPEGIDFVDIAVGHRHSLALRSGETAVLTILAEPNNLDCITPSAGAYECYLGQRVLVKAPRCPVCPNVYKLDHWTGPIPDPNAETQFVIMDQNRTLTAYYTPDTKACGDECHPILQGDLNEDCYINFEDFAIYAASWLECTHPDCD